MNTPAREHGMSLVEVIVFMVIVGVAVAGVLSVYVTTTSASADPLVRKQALAIAESLLEEVRAMPFTFCDPDDPNVYTATSAAGCTTAEGPGPEAGETRYSTATPFDNVNDYAGFSSAAAAPPGICPIWATVPGDCNAALAGYVAAVAVTPTALGVIPAADALLITVTVTGPSNETVTLSSVRTRYAPNL
jgi:MSHA pilin protein MshD